MSKRFFLLLLAIVLVAGLRVPFLQAANEQPKEISVEKLFQRIEQLENRVAELEKQPQRQLHLAPAMEAKLQSLQQSVPPNWVPQEFNGQTFYYVPLGNGKPAATLVREK